jgi:hypothetical protein
MLFFKNFLVLPQLVIMALFNRDILEVHIKIIQYGNLASGMDYCDGTVVTFTTQIYRVPPMLHNCTSGFLNLLRIFSADPR